MLSEQTHKVADACATGAVCLAGLSLSQINDVVQIVAGLMAIVVGAVSLYARWKRWK